MNFDVYIDHWVIADGNYEEFREGETRQFALEFYSPNALTKVNAAPKRLIPMNGYKYHVSAEVAFASEGICVIDFGLRAYSNSTSDTQAGHKFGDFVEGDIALGVDPFFYFDELSNIAAVPPLIYKWSIDKIEQDTTPLVLADARGRPVYVRDESRRSYERVGATDENTIGPPQTGASYVLHCTKLDDQPRKNFRNHG
jgi:hypothetical protein